MRDTIRLQARTLRRIFDSLEEAQGATLRSLLAALRARDAETYQHSARVVRLGLLLGRECGLDRAGCALKRLT